MNVSLITPLDVIRFTLAYLVVVYIPGYAIAVVARPRAPLVERLALAIPCAYSLVALSGLATALAGLPYGLLAYAALAVPAIAAAAYTSRRRRSTTPVMTDSTNDGRWWLVAVAVAIVQAVVLGAVFAGYVAPPNGDAVSHVQWTNMVAHAHVFPLALLSAHTGDATGGFYPPVFHVLTALVLGTVPMSPIHAVFYSVLATAIVLPLGLFAYVRGATGNARIAALATLAALAFDPLPLYIATQGLYTFVASQLFIPALALALRDGLGRGDRRAVALSAVLGVGLFYTHPTEFITAALLALAIVPASLRDLRGWTRAVAYGAGIALVWTIAALPALAAVRRTMITGAQPEIVSSHYFAATAHLAPLTRLAAYIEDVFGRNESYIVPALAVGGAAWCLVQRRWLGLVASQAVLSLLFLDATSTQLLRRFYDLSFPWGLWERLAATHYWFTLPLAAIGAHAIGRAAWRVLRAKSRPFIALVYTPAALLAILLPLSVTTARIGAFVRTHVVMTAPDLGALAWLTRHAAVGSVVANDSSLTRRIVYDVPLDAGLWSPDLGGPQPLFGRQDAGPGDIDARIYLMRHIADTPLPVEAARFTARYHVRYLLYGAGPRVTATRHLDLRRLLNDRYLRLVYTSAPACRTSGTEHMGSCPTGQSYIFALDRTAGEPIIP
jgi:hypothetical protein